MGGRATLRQTTIAALSTPCGEGGIGVVRVSGPEALAVADRVVRLPGGRKLSSLPPRTVGYGRALTPDGTEIDEVIAFTFHAPRSYTREDLVEIQAHGGAVVLRTLVQALLAAGATLAEPGEFTQRAVINGRLSLAQAEAVLDLVRAKTKDAASAALRRLSGDGGRELAAIEAAVLSLLARVEASLDFPEDVAGPEIDDLGGQAREALAHLDRILAGAERGRLLTEGAAVAIVGRPNVGKSSLLNALLGEERAIVTDLPGTTRDAVAEEISLAGIPVRLIDTAGLGEAGDEIEVRGMARSRREIERADLSLLVLDGSAPLTEEDEAVAREVGARGPGVVVFNKADWPTVVAEAPLPVSAWPAVRVSARCGLGLAELSEAIAMALGGRQVEGTPLLSHLRQIEAAREAHGALSDFLRGLDDRVPWDLLAEELRAGLGALSRLSGRELGPALLHEVFSRFCVGK